MDPLFADDNDKVLLLKKLSIRRFFSRVKGYFFWSFLSFIERQHVISENYKG